MITFTHINIEGGTIMTEVSQTPKKMPQHTSNKNEGKISNLKEERKGDWRAFFTFFSKIKLSWPLIVICLVVSLCYNEVVVNLPGSTAELLSGDFSTSALVELFISYGSMLALTVGIIVLQLYAKARSLKSARNSLWRIMMGIQAKYYNEHDPAYLLSAITNDADMAITNIVMMIVQTIPAIYFVIRSLLVVKNYNIKLMFSLFIMIPIYIVYAIIVGRWQYRTNFKILSRIGGLTGYLTERLRNLSLIKSFANEKVEEENGTNTAKALYKAKMQAAYINTTNAGYIMSTDVIVMVLAVIWGALLLREGAIKIDAWLAFFIIVPMVNGNMRTLVQNWIALKGVHGSIVRLNRIIEAPKEPAYAGDTPVTYHNGDISINGVTFSYGGDTSLLSDISFTIPKGKSTAIIGLNGSGKTTLLSMLERFYEPSSGSITIGGIAISRIDLKEYRSHFAYVQQDTGVLSGTIRSVITYGVDRDVSDDELIKVAKLSGIYDYISTLAKGFDTEVAPWGLSLSGGQRQRLVIARELLKKSDVMLLDEPTSALDPSTAREIQESILRLFKDKTIVTITHDLSQIAAVDQIVVIHNGTVEACGTHTELMEKSELYRELVAEQSYQEAYGL